MTATPTQVETQPATPARYRKRWRRIGSLIGVLVLLGAANTTAELVTALKVERHLSEAVYAAGGLEMPPKVSISDAPWPYYLAGSNGKVAGLIASSTDVELPEFGIVNIRTVLRDIAADRSAARTGDFAGRRVHLVKRSIQLDGVALGAQLGITDLNIANPKDISPTAYLSSAAQLTGTPPGQTQPVSVLARLRVKANHFRVEPYEIVSAPGAPRPQGLTAAQEAQLLAAFAFDSVGTKWPLVGQVSRLSCGGGSIYIDSELRGAPFSLDMLRPVAVHSTE